MSFSDFEASRKGASIRPILYDREAIRRMESLSAAGRPALLAIVARIEEVAPALTDTEKQHVGRWVHRVLGPRGWHPVKKTRLPKGGLFTTAAVYRRIGPVPDWSVAVSAIDSKSANLDAAGRLSAARARIKLLPAKPQSVKSFLSEKRRTARQEK